MCKIVMRTTLQNLIPDRLRLGSTTAVTGTVNQQGCQRNYATVEKEKEEKERRKAYLQATGEEKGQVYRGEGWNTECRYFD